MYTNVRQCATLEDFLGGMVTTRVVTTTTTRARTSGRLRATGLTMHDKANNATFLSATDFANTTFMRIKRLTQLQHFIKIDL
eukprot:SAG11_NODE_540_length_8654_cov_9.626110_4_plen_82_part_00